MTAILIVSSAFYGLVLLGYSRLGSLPSNFAYLAATFIIFIAIQYVLLGSFDPRRLLKRKSRYPAFMAEYNHLVSPTSPAGQSQQGWEFEMINRLKKEASQFKKRPIRDYLDY